MGGAGRRHLLDPFRQALHQHQFVNSGLMVTLEVRGPFGFERGRSAWTAISVNTSGRDIPVPYPTVIPIFIE